MPWTLPSILTPARREEAIHHLNAYFAKRPDLPAGVAFSGSRFDDFAGGGDAADVANRITSDDIVALSFLSVGVDKGQAALALLEGQVAEEINQMLAGFSPDLSITTEAGRNALDGERLDTLWKAIRAVPSFGPVRTSKLLARKRPHLVPIYDSVVRRQFGAADSSDQWTAFIALFEDESLAAHLTSLRDEAEVPESLSLLRVLDVVAWMEGKLAGSPSDEVGDEEL